MNKEQDKPVTFTKHECTDFRNIVYCNSEHYTMDKCMICDRVVRFRWKSLLMRIKSLL